MIDQRPAEAAERSQPGHWEADLTTGEQNRSAIGTIVERSSRFAILLHLPARHTAEAVRDVLVAALSRLPQPLRGERPVLPAARVLVTAQLPAHRRRAAAHLGRDRTHRVAAPLQMGERDPLVLGQEPR